MKKLIVSLMLLLMVAGSSAGETWVEYLAKSLKKDEVPHVVEFLKRQVELIENFLDASDSADERKLYRSQIVRIQTMIKELNEWYELKSTVWLK